MSLDISNHSTTRKPSDPVCQSPQKSTTRRSRFEKKLISESMKAPKDSQKGKRDSSKTRPSRRNWNSDPLGYVSNHSRRSRSHEKMNRLSVFRDSDISNNSAKNAGRIRRSPPRPLTRNGKDPLGSVSNHSCSSTGRRARRSRSSEKMIALEKLRSSRQDPHFETDTEGLVDIWSTGEYGITMLGGDIIGSCAKDRRQSADGYFSEINFISQDITTTDFQIKEPSTFYNPFYFIATLASIGWPMPCLL